MALVAPSSPIPPVPPSFALPAVLFFPAPRPLHHPPSALSHPQSLRSVALFHFCSAPPASHHIPPTGPTHLPLPFPLLLPLPLSRFPQHPSPFSLAAVSSSPLSHPDRLQDLCKFIYSLLYLPIGFCSISALDPPLFSCSRFARPLHKPARPSIRPILLLGHRRVGV